MPKNVDTMWLTQSLCPSETHGGFGPVRWPNTQSESHSRQTVGKKFGRRSDVYFHQKENSCSHWKTTTAEKQLQGKWRQVSYSMKQYDSVNRLMNTCKLVDICIAIIGVLFSWQLYTHEIVGVNCLLYQNDLFFFNVPTLSPRIHAYIFKAIAHVLAAVEVILVSEGSIIYDNINNWLPTGPRKIYQPGIFPISRLIIFNSRFLKKIFVSMTVHSILGNLIVFTA